MILWILIVLLVVFWAFSFWGPYEAWRMGGFIHIVLVVVLILVLLQLFGPGLRRLP
jgi:predicted ferric reductase